MFGMNAKTLDHRGERCARSHVDSVGLVGWAAIAAFVVIDGAAINRHSTNEIPSPPSVVVSEPEGGSRNQLAAGGADADSAKMEATGARPSWLRIAN